MNNRNASEISKSLDAIIFDIHNGKKPTQKSIKLAEKVIEQKIYSQKNKEKAKLIKKNK